MSTIDLTYEKRPIRIGFVVKDGSIQELKKAALLNNFLWGGQYNPIIPEQSELTDLLIELFVVDTLVPISISPNTQILLEKYSYLREPNYFENKLFVNRSHHEKKQLAYLDSLAVMEYFWDEEFKHKPIKYKSNCIYVNWEESDKLDNIYSIIFGKYIKIDNLEADFENLFVRSLKAKSLKIKKEDNLKPSLLNKVYPISLTTQKLLKKNVPWSNYGLFIGDESNFYDLLHFWNLRASGIKLEFLPINYLNKFEDYINAYLKELDSIPNRSPNFDDFITIHHHSIPNEHLKDIVASLKHSKGLCYSSCTNHSWNGLNVKPSTPYFLSDTTLAHVEESKNKYRVHFNVPKFSLIRSSRKSIKWQMIATTINTYEEYSFPNHSLSLPFIYRMNEFYSRQVNILPFKTRVQKDGLSLISDFNENSFSVYPISNKKIILEIFKTMKISASISQAGLITEKIIRKIGHIESGRVFKIRGVRNLINDLKSDDCISRSQATNKIWNNEQFRDHENLFIESRSTPKLNTNLVFDYLLKNEFFRAGLYLLCDECNLKTWLSLKNIDDRWICPYCGYSNLTSIHLKTRGDWMFRKSGLLEKDNNQEGAIPVSVR